MLLVIRALEQLRTVGSDAGLTPRLSVGADSSIPHGNRLEADSLLEEREVPPASRGPVTLFGAAMRPLQPGLAVFSTDPHRALDAHPADPRVWPAVISRKIATFRGGGRRVLGNREGRWRVASTKPSPCPSCGTRELFPDGLLRGYPEIHAAK